ncbi:MAG: DUF4150 domain-containing protein [Pseudomonadota bacterium]
MANDVFANGREISCKKSTGKSIAAFPDVCMTPPTAPPTPPGVPIPYPNTAMASDTSGGTKTVKISGAEAMLKNKSYFKTSTGDEAGSAPKKGVVTSKIKGKAYFNMWSMDVKFEGENVVRHFDLTTHNHGSSGQTPPWSHVANQTVGGNSCKKIVSEIHPYGEADCPTGSQSHHIIDNSTLTMVSARSTPLKHIISDAEGRAKRNLFQPGSGHPGEAYDEKAAPCICLAGDATVEGTEHYKAHQHTKKSAAKNATPDGKISYDDASNEGAKSIKKAKKLQEWESECIKLVLDAYFKDFTDDTEMRAPGNKCEAADFDDGHGNMCRASELIDA